MRDLVVYYSLEGNTKQAAETIARYLNSDIIPIRTIKKVPEGSRKFVVGGAQATFGMAPGIEEISIDFDKYDRIILGTPIWAGKAAPAINSFLKKYPVSDKVIALFTCSGGGDNDKCVILMKKKLKNLVNTVALADKNSKLAIDNEEKIMKFVKEV